MIDELLPLVISAVTEAGADILEVYGRDFKVDYKQDDSPLTEADNRSHAILRDRLQPTGIPILSEEGKNIPYREREKWQRLWLVDPLDGTKEFVKKNGEFTVNVALVENGTPILGVVYTPVLDELFFGGRGIGAYKLTNAAEKIGGLSNKDKLSKFIEMAEKLEPISQLPQRRLRVVASRSHRSREVDDYIARLKQRYEVEIVSKGSSLKLCLLAEGKADVYPRFSPTKEWDTAAGHAIIGETGRQVVSRDTGQPLRYNKENLLNSWFFAGLRDPLEE